MSIAHALAFLALGVGCPLLALALLRLRQLLGRYHNPVTRVQAVVIAAVLAHTFVFGLVFLNNDMTQPVLSFEDTKFFTRGVELGVAIVAALSVLWLVRPERRAGETSFGGDTPYPGEGDH